MTTPQGSPVDMSNKRSATDPQKPELHNPPQDPSGWLTREQSAHLLGVAVQTIKNYERRGLLHPERVSRRDIKGREQVVVVHDPLELAKVREALNAEEAKREVDTSRWLTRNESTDLLSVSAQTLKNYERLGRLHPRKASRRDARGHEQNIVVYDPKELTKLPRGRGRPFSSRETGEINARCYELFEQGKAICEIVIELRETSENIRELYDQWLDDSGAKLIITPEARSALENIAGPFADVAELIALVTAKLEPKES